MANVILYLTNEWFSVLANALPRAASCDSTMHREGDAHQDGDTKEMLLKFLPSFEEAEVRQIGSIQRWQRGNLVGSGSYGKVYLAMNADTAELFVVKQVPFTAIDKREEVLQLEQEIALLAQLEHANIVRYLGTELNAMTSELSIFLEYMPGGSIADLVRNQHLCTPVALMATARLISSIAAQARVRVCRGFCHHCTITIESRLRATLSHLPGGHLAEHLPGGHLAENCFLKQLGPSRSKCRCVCSLNRESTDPEPATRAIH